MKKRLLVADDILDVVESIRKMLLPYYDVDIATSGSEVLDLFEENKYLGLIIDVEFVSGMSGLETAKLLREISKELKIIIISATDYSDGARQQAVDIGAAFLEKTVPVEDILRIMEI